MIDVENARASVRETCDTAFLKNASVLITGATGLIGSMLARTLLSLDDGAELGIRLILPVRSLDRLDPAIGNDTRVRAFEADLTETLRVDGPVDYIVHAASPTASKELSGRSKESAAFMTGSVRALLSLAEEKQVKKFLYLSSMEVYTGLAGMVTEDMTGTFDPAIPRSCYPLSKLYGEKACMEASGVPAACVRLAQTFGEGISKTENRVFAQFARSALNGADLVLKTEGRSIGNYLHVSDCMSALVLLLQKGEGIYNAAGDGCHMTIKELAGLTANLLSDGKSGLAFDIAPSGSYPPDSAYVLDNSKLKSLGWVPKYNVSDMILSLGRDLKGAQ